nr:transcription termination factor, mitochondrial isoform X2 [Halyomorpha halys]
MSLFSSHFKLISNDLFHVFKTLPSFKSYVNLLGKSSRVKKNTPLYTNTGNVHYLYCKESKNKGLTENFTNGKKQQLEENRNGSENVLKKFQEQVKSLSCMMKCNETTASALLLKFPFLETANMDIINSKVITLLESGIDKEELMNDMWILKYSLTKLKERIQLVQQMNCYPIKPWHLRCSEAVFQRLSQNKENNRLALSPFQSVKDYICKRLHLNESQVHSFAKRHPPVMRVKVAKLKEVIDFLYSEGFTSQQIFNTPRILCHSLKTIQQVFTTFPLLLSP